MSKYTMQHWLATLDAEALAALLALRPDATEPPPTTLAMVADRLSAPHSVRYALDRLDRTTLDVLAAAQAIGGDMTAADVVARLDGAVTEESALRFLAEGQRFGLLWPAAGGTYRLANPLRGGPIARHLAVHWPPPAPRWSPIGQDVVDTAGGAAVLRTLLGVEQLIEVCSATPLQLLRTGGVGVKELRRLTKALGTDEIRTRLWLTLAYHADLLDADEGEILPTDAADGWLAGTPGERLVPLIRTWWEMPGSPTIPDRDGKLPQVLAHAYQDGDRQLRHAIVDWYTDQSAGAALADRDELIAFLSWLRPGMFGDARSFAGPFHATMAEAEALGVLAQEALSSWGHALADDGDVGVVERSLPEATGSARLQADLTAVVTGLPSGELAALLNLAADAGDRDTASVWRFSPDSVRRALDAGYSADRLVAELTAVASHGVPQPLEYLVRDVARRHGEISVVPVGCCVLAKDAALAAELAAHRSLRLRLLGAEILVSGKSVDETMALLRQHGYAPVATDAGGTPVVQRAQPRRAQQRPQYWSTPKPAAEPDLFLLATTLLDRGVAQEGSDDEVGWHLNRREQAMLARAIETETPIEIVYIDQNDRRSQRVITPYGQAGDLLEAWCHMRDDERHFLISRIERVNPAPALD